MQSEIPDELYDRISQVVAEAMRAYDDNEFRAWGNRWILMQRANSVECIEVAAHCEAARSQAEAPERRIAARMGYAVAHTAAVALIYPEDCTALVEWCEAVIRGDQVALKSALPPY